MLNYENYRKDSCKKYRECKDCNSKRELKRYYDNKDEIPNQRKIFMKKIKKDYCRNKMIGIYNLKD